MNWHGYRRLARLAAVCVVVVGASSGRADAQIPSAEGQFHACVRVDRDGEEGRLMRLVAESEACRRNETRIQWSVAGPQGPQGPQGVQGPEGPQGPAGVNGTDGVNGTNGTRAAAPCFGPGRYIDCGNGTVTDSVTGLIWLKQANCLPDANYIDANLAAAGLKQGDCGLTDGSSPGDWRLPTPDEWTATLAVARSLGCTTAGGKAPTLTDTLGVQCLVNGITMFEGVRSIAYAGSITYPTHMGRAIYGFLNTGEVSDFGKANIVGVWPVRGGSR